MIAQGNPKFLEIVTNWQKKLGTVDVVLNTWLDVQKKWQALESIFVGSADIRVQLPEDSKRFDVVNADFQASYFHVTKFSQLQDSVRQYCTACTYMLAVCLYNTVYTSVTLFVTLILALLPQDLMKSAPDTPNVVEACNLEGRQERLDGLLSQLEMCEKALQVPLH